VYVRGRSLAGIAGSNPAKTWISSLVGVVFCQEESLRRANHSSGGVLPSVVRPCVIEKSRQSGGLGWLGTVAPWGMGSDNYCVVMISKCHPINFSRHLSVHRVPITKPGFLGVSTVCANYNSQQQWCRSQNFCPVPENEYYSNKFIETLNLFT